MNPEVRTVRIFVSVGTASELSHRKVDNSPSSRGRFGLAEKRLLSCTFGGKAEH